MNVNMNLFETIFYQINKNALDFLGVYLNEVNLNEVNLNEVNLNYFEENISNIMPTEVFSLMEEPDETFTSETFTSEITSEITSEWHENFASEPLTSEPLTEPLWNISDWQFIILGFMLLFAIIYLEILILHMNKPNSNEEIGRYRYICRGRSFNNKRCKRCVKNTVSCYQHTE